MNLKHCFVITALSFSALTLQAQGPSTNGNGKESVFADHQMNFIKINLTGIALKNYGIQYERVLNKRLSVAASYRIMPTGKLPFASSIANAIGDDDPDAKKTIENMRLGNYAITPEVRLYAGKGYGRGFYIALFYRYASFTVENLPVDYDNTNSLNFAGKLSSNTGGILLGAQWALGKHMCLDWQIIGPHYGSGNGNFVGVSSQPLTPAQQSELRQNLEDLDIPLTDKTIVVNASGASVKLDGPWGGIRSAITLGVKF